MDKLLDWLLSLNHVSISPGTRFAFGVSWAVWIIPILLVLLLLGYFSYRRQSASPRKKIALGIVRALLLASVFLLFCRPMLVVDREERTRSVVAVWVDNSASMTLEDPYRDPQMRTLLTQAQADTRPAASQPAGAASLRPDRYQLALHSLEHAQWLKDLTDTQDVAIFTGSSHAQLLGTAHNPDQLKPLLAGLARDTPAGESTDIPTVTQEILQSVQGQRVSALVLYTDGQTTEPGSRLDLATASAQQASAKLFTLPLGDPQEPLNLKLSQPQIPENTFVRDPVAVKMHLAGTGIDKPTPARITLYRTQGPSETITGAPLATRDVTLDPSKREMDVEMIFKPEKTNAEKSEKFDLLARVDLTNGGEELSSQDNFITAHTNVLDAQINVLYVEGYPRWEFRYVKNELIREKTVNISTLLLSADEDFAQDADPRVVDKDGRETFPGPITRFPETAEELNKYDVLIIGDVEPTFFSPSQQKLIVDFVRKTGGGVAWIAGNGWDPEAYKGTPLDVLLPIVPDELDPRARVMAPAENAPFTPVLTAAGRDSNLFRFFDDPDENVKQMANMPDMYWFKPVQGIKGSAEVLAVHPTRSQGGAPAPLIVTDRYGEGRTLFSAVEDTWRWRRYTGEPLFQSYWLQMCRLLYKNKALGQNRRLELAADAAKVEVGRPIKVSLTVKDPTLAGQVPAQVPVLITDKEGRPLDTLTLQHSPSSGGDEPDSLQGMITASQVGDVLLTVQPGILPIDVPPFEVSVEPPQREFEKIATDVDSLTTLATKTGGAVVPIYKSEELARQIPDRSIPLILSDFEELWYKPIALVLVVALATIEWLLRKSAGLI
ncbi:MAG TPA: hypothetical protein VH253_03500 [Phycisphaerae bacterium]|nr:hypothetical protein [Phycisphaerae bacterium]